MEAMMRTVYAITLAVLLIPTLLYAEAQKITVGTMKSPPVIDGSLQECGTDGWSKVPVKPALEDDKDNHTGNLDVEIKVAISDGQFFMAARWPDKTEDLE